MKLQAQGITKSYGSTFVLEDVSLSLQEGELVCLLGASGVGKTTLFNILSGLVLPDSGRVFLNGEDITGRPGKIGYMQQKDLLLPYRTVLDNTALPLLLRGVRKKEAREIAREYFAAFGLSGTEEQFPDRLSGGMRQRAALLRTYLFSGEAALLDEPFSALDAITKASMHNWYLGIAEKLRLSTVFITHDIDEATLLSDRICVLSGRPGKICGRLSVSSPRPRGREFTLSSEFLFCKRELLSLLGEASESRA